MRVISGKYKGRRILVESKYNYRPTLTRVREDIFNLLSHNKNLNVNLNEVIFCDLFAGTGSIGIEALSRELKKLYLMILKKTILIKLRGFLKILTEITMKYLI